ncbi:hypothetical protein SAY87_027794 [Trapa incisa]|uniref:Beta-glucuronosyltransferase GlcAT14A n=1 Tax=Trapa incisa TaxID=236973 RepID=A0AAN7JN03_9MYRT|nr:hypothetical protein SAY87_027794 [Trapa incisa]
MQNPPSPTTSTATSYPSKTTIYIILSTSLFFFVFFTLSSSWAPTLPRSVRPDPLLFPSRRFFASDPSPPSIAYFISGSAGDSGRILRLLYAAYHPRNHYLLHLDRSAPQSEREKLAITVQSDPIFAAARNVDVLGKADFAYQKGSSPISATLHGASMLLRLASNWDWFINLDAHDYPLIPQDDLLHILSYLPKDLNFVNHTSHIGWRESKKLKPIIVDPGLYLTEKTQMFYASQKRGLPNAYRLFTGSSFNILSRSFVEHCILGTDNLPRTLLMYLSNTPSSITNYFQSILCNSHQFKRTVINHNLQYAAFNPTEKPRELNVSDFDALVSSGAAFASHLGSDDLVLDRIDKEILDRVQDRPVPGGWCLGQPSNSTCMVWGDASVLRPGPGARRLEKLMVKMLSDDAYLSRQCMVEQ